MMAKAKTETAKVMALPRPGKARRTGARAWIERTNPLTRLSLRAAQGIYDTARGGGYTRLQYIYAEIEKTDPTLFTCVDRRLSALSALGWRVVANVEGAEAEAQKKKLEEMLDAAVGLSAAIEHMGLAFFRGYSFCEPYMRDGRLAFNCPPSWEFNRSPDGTWWHNPLVIEGDAGGEGQTAFDPEAVVHIERVRAVDYPALALYLRHEVAEDEWGRFLERYGIPPVILEMPPLAQPGDADRFASAAQQVYEALCGAVPNGTKVNTLAEARGADPFSAFIEHQEKTMVRLCTGGTLGSIAEATGIGSGASDAQGDVWREIVSRDAVLIGEEFTRWFGRYVFPEGMLVRFELGTDRRATPDEVFDTAARARQAGYRFTKEYLETETGAELEADAGNLPGGSGEAPGGLSPVGAGRYPLLNKEPATPLQTSKDFISEQTRPDTRAPVSAALEALAKDQGAAAEAVARLLENPTPGRAAALLYDLPNLIPEDPALAAVIAEEMAKAYAGALGGERNRGPQGEELANGACRAKAPAHCPTHGTPRERRDKGFRDRYGNGNPETLAANPEMNIERGRAVFTHLAWTQKGFEPHAMYREGLGWIGVAAGTAGDPRPYDGPDEKLKGQTYLGGSGISHILAKHPGAEKILADVIQYGDVFHHRDEDSEHPNFRKITIVKDDQVVILSKFRTGRLLITAFDPGEKVDPETGESHIDKKGRQDYIAAIRARKPFGKSGGKK